MKFAIQTGRALSKMSTERPSPLSEAQVDDLEKFVSRSLQTRQM